MKKKTLAVALAFVLVIAMSVAGTFAYLTATTNAVTNTFTVASLTGEDGSLTLQEHEAEKKNDGTYQLGTKLVTSNEYANILPGVALPKDPFVSADIGEGVSAYLYIEVVDTLNSGLTYGITDDWTKLEGVTGKNGGQIYVYATAPITESVENINILTNNQIAVANELSVEEGNNLGSLTFYAYLCQSAGFESAAAAFNACFGTTTTP